MPRTSGVAEGGMCRRRSGIAAGVVLLVVLPIAAWAADAEPMTLQQILQEPPSDEAAVFAEHSLWTTETPVEQEWTFRYQARWLTNSATSYEFGVPEYYVDAYSPLSRLEFPINSLWHGFEVGLRRSQWELQFEWLTPVNDAIQGDLEDRDWMNPGSDFTDLGLAEQSWRSGQMADLNLDVRLWERCFGLPVDCWGLVGFRWQRFNIMTHDAAQVKANDVWLYPPDYYPGNVLSFDQQYWMTCLGGQLRGVLNLPWAPPIHWTFQGDWANTQAYNIDHHLLRAGDRYTMERTHGDACHLGLTAEAFLTKHLSLGAQADYLGIDTHGRHHWVNVPLGDDETWTNGVHVWSQQTWLSVFVGFRI